MRPTRRDWLRLGAAGGLSACLGGRSGAGGDEAVAGRIFAIASIMPGAERNRTVVAIDPGNGSWSQVADSAFPSSRVSRDGRWLATVEDREDEPERGGVWLTDLRAVASPRRVTEKVGRPSWSPDGAELIVSGGEPGSFETWRVRVDGSRCDRLPFGEGDLVVDWSRDGEWLLFVGSDEGAASPAYVARPDGRDARPVSRGHREGDDVFVARWQHRFLPDASGALYFQATESQCNLWRVDLDGGRPRLLVPERRDDAPFQAVGSPDGTRFVVMYFDRSVREDGKKNDVIRARHLEIYDPTSGEGRPIPLPDSEDLWLLDWA